MRENKFRVWDKILKRYFIFTLEELLNYPRQRCEIRFNFEVRGQYTGIRDKNNKDIYEKDLVKNTYFTSLQQYTLCQECHKQHLSGVYVGQIEWYRGEFIWVCSMLSDEQSLNLFNPKYLEVIGNVYENLELLK